MTSISTSLLRLHHEPTVGSVNQKDAQTLLEAYGWTRTTGGKHAVKMERPGHRPITLPHRSGRDYSPGLKASILRQAGLR